MCFSKAKCFVVFIAKHRAVQWRRSQLVILISYVTLFLYTRDLKENMVPVSQVPCHTAHLSKRLWEFSRNDFSCFQDREGNKKTA